MVYSYLRVSTQSQAVDNQQYEIEQYCAKQNITVNLCVKEKISGTKSVKERKLGNLIKKMKSGDTLIVSEISRLGRSLYMIMEIFNLLEKKGVHFFSIKENFTLEPNSINSKVLIFAFGLASEIERNLISQRTKEALALKKANGKKLGRPKGSKNKEHKLNKYKDKIEYWMKVGKSKCFITKKLRCNIRSLNSFLSQNIF